MRRHVQAYIHVHCALYSNLKFQARPTSACDKLENVRFCYFYCSQIRVVPLRPGCLVAFFIFLDQWLSYSPGGDITRSGKIAATIPYTRQCLIAILLKKVCGLLTYKLSTLRDSSIESNLSYDTLVAFFAFPHTATRKLSGWCRMPIIFHPIFA